MKYTKNYLTSEKTKVVNIHLTKIVVTYLFVKKIKNICLLNLLLFHYNMFIVSCNYADTIVIKHVTGNR